MTGSGPEQPFEPQYSARQPDPNAPLDYPADAALPPPVYPMYPGAQGYPGGYPGYSPGAAPGYYPGTPYDPYDPYRPTKPTGTNGWAIAALVTSLVGLMCCGLPSIIGLIMGLVGMRETKRTGQDGYALALTGVIIGGLVVVGWVLYVLLSIGIYASSWQWAP